MVSMESTSDYWRIWYYVLEAHGVPVQLVNSSQARNLAGRPKTGRHDSQWQWPAGVLNGVCKRGRERSA
jgi:transposase